MIFDFCLYMHIYDNHVFPLLVYYGTSRTLFEFSLNLLYFLWFQNLNSFWLRKKMLARREIPTNSSSVFSHFPRKRCFHEFSYLSNWQPRQNSRALIDAYGCEKSRETSWKNTEEEEFDWKGMIPTPTVGFSSEKPAIVAASATSSVSRVSPGLNSNTEYRPPVLPATFETRPSIKLHAPRPPIYPSNQ